MSNSTKKSGGNAEISFKEGYEMLLKEAQNYQKPPFEKPTLLQLRYIRKALSVFQPRHIRKVGETCASLAHRNDLIEALRVSKGNPLDPITVYWTGQAYRVIDGHHRLEAYLKYYEGKLSTAIPVRTFEGTPEQAIEKAIELNSKNHLPMSKDERLDRAWLMTVIFSGQSKSSVMRTCKVSDGTVGAMRRRAKEIEADYYKLMSEWPIPIDPDGWKEDATKLTWAEARTKTRRSTPEGDDWMSIEAAKFAQRFGEYFGTKMASKAELVANGLYKYSERLAKELYLILKEDFSEEPEEALEDSDF